MKSANKCPPTEGEIPGREGQPRRRWADLGVHRVRGVIRAARVAVDLGVLRPCRLGAEGHRIVELKQVVVKETASKAAGRRARWRRPDKLVDHPGGLGIGGDHGTGVGVPVALLEL